jgi:predicted N-acetyltransferase YhbS
MPERERIRVSAPADEPAIAEVLTAAFGDEHGPVVARLVAALRVSPAWDPALSFVALSVSDQVLLEGSPDFYPRFGFGPGGSRGFRRPSLRIPKPAFMVRPLPGYEPWMTGTLVYADPFWRLDCVGLRDPTQ